MRFDEVLIPRGSGVRGLRVALTDYTSCPCSESWEHDSVGLASPLADSPGIQRSQWPICFLAAP